MRFTKSTLLCGAVLLLVGSAAPVFAQSPADRTETPVRTSAPADGVTESFVRVRIPLPVDVGPHPAECDWLSYLRYRDANGPAAAADADRILVAQPGILEGAAAFDSVARDTVAAAARRGRPIEFWALDRRSNCLDDHLGVEAALSEHNPDVALDYYYGGRPVDGHTFGGFESKPVAWLGHVGIAQTVRDQYDLLRHELPDQRVRESKVLCGGHSLGGVITGFFAEWDFAGDPGYRQCGGYFALDSEVATSLAALSGAPSLTDPTGLSFDATQAALDLRIAPATADLPVLIGPETMTLLAIAGAAADLSPGGVSDLVNRLPRTLGLETTLRFLFSRTYSAMLTGSPSVRDFRFTNAAALGALLSNNSQPLAFLEAGLGFFSGGPVADKSVPLDRDTATALGPVTSSFLGPDRLGFPTQPSTPGHPGPLYTWQPYNHLDPSMARYATPGTEVTDIAELARSLAEQPVPFTEDYFPTRLATDPMNAGSPQIAAHLRYPNGIAAHPVLTVLAGRGLVLASGNRPTGDVVIAPGYHHLDVVTAAAQQNNGLPEPVSTALADFALG